MTAPAESILDSDKVPETTAAVMAAFDVCCTDCGRILFTSPTPMDVTAYCSSCCLNH